MNKEIIVDDINDNFPIVEDNFDALTDYVLFSQIQEKVEKMINEVEEKIDGVENIDIDLSVDGSQITITLTQYDGTENSVSFTIPTKTSQLANDSGYITKTVNDLVNYYTKSETVALDNLTNYYDKTYIDTMVGNIESILETLDIGSGV